MIYFIIGVAIILVAMIANKHWENEEIREEIKSSIKESQNINKRR